MDRAALQGQIETGLMLHAMLGRPVPPDDSLGGPAYTLSREGTEFLLAPLSSPPSSRNRTSG